MGLRNQGPTSVNTERAHCQRCHNAAQVLRIRKRRRTEPPTQSLFEPPYRTIAGFRMIDAIRLASVPQQTGPRDRSPVRAHSRIRDTAFQIASLADGCDEVADTVCRPDRWLRAAPERSSLQPVIIDAPQQIAGGLGALPTAANKGAASQARRCVIDVIPYRPCARWLKATMESSLDPTFHGSTTGARYG